MHKTEPTAFGLCMGMTTLACVLLAPFPAALAAGSFTDVAETSAEFPAAEFLKSKGIMQGYPDGTFRPGQKVTRAEAVKILVSTKLGPEEIAAFTKTSYTDIPSEVWYRPYVEAAFQKLELIDGPPKTTVFNGNNPVRRAEFLKLLFKSQGVDTGAYGEITLPLASDVADSTAWFYPAVRYAVSSLIIHVESDGMLHPEKELTRGEVALNLYHLAMYQAGKRTQAGLSTEENDLVNTLQLLEQKDFAQAGMASARALVVSRGTLTSKPTVPIVQAAVKIAEAFRAIVRTYAAGTEGRLDDVVNLAKEAWNSAEKAKQMSASLADLSTRVQTIAKSMADQARALQQSGSPAAPVK